jgi:glucan 1,3-beta-glucosidase
MSHSVNNKSHLDIPRSALSRMDNHLNRDELFLKMKGLLDNKIHGLCFSAYLEGQDPGQKSQITEAQIRSRLAIIAPYTQWIRVFSCTAGHENIPRIAHEMGLKTLVGAWLDHDRAANEEEIAGLLKIASEGYADIVAVGNEVLLREDLNESDLINYINRVKENLPGIPVGYVDAYYLFREHPRVVDACDLILSNCYPFWEYCDLEQAVDYMKQMYRIAQEAGRGKRVIITETGWPSQGSDLGGAVPSTINAAAYFVNTYQWANDANVEIFFFASFDEDWKAGPEGDCGAYWGIWDKKGYYKYAI